MYKNPSPLKADETQLYLVVLDTVHFSPKFMICHLTHVLCHQSTEILNFEIIQLMFHCLYAFEASLGFLLQTLNGR